MDKKKYITEAQNYISIMSEAVKRDNLKAFDAARQMLDETIEDYKKEKALVDEMNTTNFGVLNHIFEECLPRIFKSNKSAVRNVVKTIKEDKTLTAEFNFYNTIRNYNSSVSDSMSPEDMMRRLNESILSKLDAKKVAESNKKLRDVMLSSDIIPESHVPEDMRSLYECGNTLMRTKPSASNIFKLHESEKGIIGYLDAHKDDAVKKSVSPEKMIENFENKLKETLTESELSFIQQITDFKAPIAEKRKEKLFNKLKEDCMTAIDSMIKESPENTEVKTLKEQLDNMKYSNESVVKDVAKLLEIRDILMDK